MVGWDFQRDGLFVCLSCDDGEVVLVFDAAEIDDNLEEPVLIESSEYGERSVVEKIVEVVPPVAEVPVLGYPFVVNGFEDVGRISVGDP